MLDEKEQAAQSRLTTSKLILIVEDNEEHASLLTQILMQETPYQLAVASDGFAALKFIRYVTPDLLILDCHLPEMNGIQLYDHLHGNRALQAIPAVLISASLDEYRADLETRKLLGLQKPFELDELLKMIRQVLG